MGINPNPVPGLILPGPNDSSIPSKQQDNNNALTRWARTVSPRLLAVGNAIVYAAVPPTPPFDGYLEQIAVTGVYFVHGAGFLTFEQPFPNGLLSVQMTIGLGGGDWIINYYATGTTLAGVNVWCTSASTGPANTPLLVDYRAVGW